MGGIVSRFISWLREEETKSTDASSVGVNFELLQKALGHTIKRKELFAEALSHRSFIHQPENETLVSNERLEFLGDSILNMVVAEHLFQQHSQLPEGELTKMRSRLVNRKALSVYAKLIRLEEFILMGTSIPRSVDRGLDKILADAYEALIAAIYLDSGFQSAKEFVKRQMVEAIDSKLLTVIDVNYKSQLLEYSQAESLNTPRYITVKEEGPDHDRVFTVEVFVGEVSQGVGSGKNKKDAEQAAAEKALQKLQLL